MNKARRLFILLVIGIWVGNAALIVNHFWPSRFYLDDVEKVRHGMTFAQVRRILGPPGIYTNRPLMDQPVRLRNGPLIIGKPWATDDVTVELVFDSNEKVINNKFALPRPNWQK